MVNHSGRARNGQTLPKLPAGPLHDLPLILGMSDPDNPGKSRSLIAGASSRINGKLIFHKTIHDWHFLRSPRAIGYSTVVVDFLTRNEFDLLLVRHAKHGTEYTTTLENFLKHAFTQQRDVDVQMFLTLEHWTIRHPILEAETPAPSPQLALFEVAA